MSGRDPRWQWIEAPRRLGDAEVEMMRGPCNHLPEYVVPVESGGEVVAHLCTTCDSQLPADWGEADSFARQRAKELRARHDYVRRMIAYHEALDGAGRPARHSSGS